MYKDKVANIGLYVISKNVETLLSGAAAEELGIITFHGSVSDQYEVPKVENDVRLAWRSFPAVSTSDAQRNNNNK